MKIFDTLSGQKEKFVPIADDHVKVYSCGPTVYQFAHIGNLRAYIFTDTLRRVLRFNGYNVYQVMNITDVGHLVSDADEGEDKMQKTSREKGLDPWEVAKYFTGVFMADIESLNIEKPDLTPLVTEHIAEMLDCTEKLVELGYGYETSDGIYYDISKFKDYGKLSRLDLEGQIAGARVEVNEEKRNPADFALWKKAPKEHIMQWPSKWGMGFPGWHIECTALSLKYLGEKVDIHTGGVDHIPVHHENEIAQSEALIGKKTVKYWMHNEFLLIDGGKMSKSLGNAYTLADLKSKGFDPLVYRYFCLNGHYRSKLNFTWDALKGAQTAYTRFLEAVIANREAGRNEPINPNWALAGGFMPVMTSGTGTAVKDDEARLITEIMNEFRDAVNDDLNIPKALGAAWKLLKNPMKSRRIYETILEMDTIFGLDAANAEARLAAMKPAEEEIVDEEILALIEKRQNARKDKDWKLADQIRDDLKEMGIILEDTPDGVKYSRKG